MKAICYISSFSKGLTRHMIDDMILTINRNNRIRRVTGILIIRNKHFFQILEGHDNIVNDLFQKINLDPRHKGIIKLLDSEIEDRLFNDYNCGEFEVFQKYSDTKKLYLYFNWIKNADYMPADGLIELTKNFLKQS